MAWHRVASKAAALAALALVALIASAQAATTTLDMLYVEPNLDMKHVSFHAKSARLLPGCIPLEPSTTGEQAPKCPEMEVVINSYGLTFTCSLDAPQELSITIGPISPTDVKRMVDALLPSQPIRLSTKAGAPATFGYREMRIEESGYDGRYWLTFSQIEQGLLEAIGKADRAPKLNRDGNRQFRFTSCACAAERIRTVREEMYASELTTFTLHDATDARAT